MPGLDIGRDLERHGLARALNQSLRRFRSTCVFAAIGAALGAKHEGGQFRPAVLEATGLPIVNVNVSANANAATAEVTMPSRHIDGSFPFLSVRRSDREFSSPLTRSTPALLSNESAWPGPTQGPSRVTLPPGPASARPSGRRRRPIADVNPRQQMPERQGVPDAGLGKNHVSGAALDFFVDRRWPAPASSHRSHHRSTAGPVPSVVASDNSLRPAPATPGRSTERTPSLW